jgi:hypothetical protein
MRDNHRRNLVACLATGLLLALMAAPMAWAKPVHVEALLVPKEQIRLDFQDGSKHFVLFVKREGQAKGDGPLGNAQVTEYGMHDIIPGQSGDPRGYLTFATADGDLAYVKWRVRAIFTPGMDGNPTLLDNGYWEIVGATGKLSGLKGAGTLHIKAQGPTDRRYILDGDLTP